MTVIRVGFNLARQTYSLPLFTSNIHLQPQNKLVLATMSARYLSTMELTKNMLLISNEKKQVQVNNFKLSPPQDKPLVVLLNWLMARPKHVNKYAKMYTTRGFDVLSVRVSPWQLLWPVKGTQVIAQDLLHFLDVNFTYSPLIIHGFSIGAYQWSEVLVRLAAEPQKYKDIIDRIIGQVWDSAADITEIPIGFPHAVFPRNPVMQKALRQYVEYHLRTFDKVATCHYLRGSQMFHTNIIKAPALFLLSKTDPIGAENSNRRVRESWERNGIDVTWQLWDKSPHVGHFAKHPQEYTEVLEKFLDKITQSSAIRYKVKAKL